MTNTLDSRDRYERHAPQWQAFQVWQLAETGQSPQNPADDSNVLSHQQATEVADRTQAEFPTFAEWLVLDLQVRQTEAVEVLVNHLVDQVVHQQPTLGWGPPPHPAGAASGDTPGIPSSPHHPPDWKGQGPAR